MLGREVWSGRGFLGVGNILYFDLGGSCVGVYIGKKLLSYICKFSVFCM